MCANGQKYKALISKYKAYILKYMACIFHDKPCVFSDKAEAPKKSPQKATKNKRVPGRKPNRIRHVARNENKAP